MALVLFELVVSQGKYFFNDFMGRRSDQYFLRVNTNLFPKEGLGVSLMLVYVSLRAVAGIVGLCFTIGSNAAYLGSLTILLQIMYEFIKLSRSASRGVGAFIVVSSSYGVRGLVGLAATDDRLVPSQLGAIVFLWMSGVAAIFLLAYWYREADYYINKKRTNRKVLSRYKPGLVRLYSKQMEEHRRGQLTLRDIVFSLTACNALLLGFQNPSYPQGILAAPTAAYIVFVAAMWIILNRREVATNPIRRWIAVAALASIALLGACHSLMASASLLLPFSLSAIAGGTHLLLFSIPEPKVLGEKGSGSNIPSPTR